MQDYQITKKDIVEFRHQLYLAERAEGTVEKYLRDVERFSKWLDGREVSRERTAEWKELLVKEQYAPTTINSMLASIHCFFRFKGLDGCQVRFLRIQRQMFREQQKELTKQEYLQLVKTAREQKKERLALLIETICGTGIRVSEVPYLTVETLQTGRAVISLKGKIRTILIPEKLVKKLKVYARKEKIVSGEIFLTKNGTGISRKQIWAEMKRLCRDAGVAATKVFPHNLRHLFARVFYQSCHDIAHLADVLGHSNIETTRIYLLTTGSECRCWLEQLALVV